MSSASSSAVREGLADGFRSFGQSVRNAPHAARELRRDPRSVVKGAALGPLLVLYGHTLLDSVDRGGFNVILPEIRDQFGLSTDEITGVAGMAILVSLILGVPAAYLSDRGKRRIWWLASGALLAAVFSTFTGIATSVGVFVVARAGFGLGIRLNDPVQGSLLADYYAVDTRPTTFAGRQGMDILGQLIGPLFFGVTAAVFGWRAAVLSIAIPAAILFVLSMRLPEPVRGAPEREAMGGSADDLFVEEEPAAFWESMRILHRIPSLRRIYFAIPCFVGGIIGINVLLPLFQEEIFGLTSSQRGAFASFTNVAGIVGLFVGVPIAKRYLTSGRPEGMLDLLRAGGIVATLALGGMALSPNLVGMALSGLVFFFVASLFLPIIATLLTMIVPARVRGLGFAMMAFWAVPGLVLLPIAGAVGNEFGLRWGMLVGLPLLTGGALIVARGKDSLRLDIERAFQLAMESIATKPVPADVADGGAVARALAAARARLHRIEPGDLAAAMADGALVVDLRPARDRLAHGALPGAVVVERIHLEWRLDPTSPDCLPGLTGERQIVLFCNEGYASSLAAAALVDLGVTRATDLVGGFQAWVRAQQP